MYQVWTTINESKHSPKFASDQKVTRPFLELPEEDVIPWAEDILHVLKKDEWITIKKL